LSSVFTFWVSMGQSFSPTVSQQPWLPPNPTSQCFNQSDSWRNGTAIPTFNYSIISLNTSTRLTDYDNAMEAFTENRSRE